MCFGNDSPPQAPQMAAPPPPPEIMDVIDEVTGVQAIVTTDSNGKKRRVISRLPRTQEEEERYKLGEDIISQAMKNIIELRKYDIDAFTPFEPLIKVMSELNEETQKALGEVANIGNIGQEIQNFREMQNAIVEKEFERVRRQRIEDFTHMGRSGSSAASEYLASLDREAIEAGRKVDMMASDYGEDLASKRLGRNAQAFGLQQLGRDQKLKAAQSEYALRKDQLADLDRRRQNAIQENKEMIGVGSSIIGADANKALQSQAPQLANQTFAMQSADSLNRFNADVNRQMVNFNMANRAYEMRPPSWQDIALQTGSRLAGRYVGGF